MDLWWMVSEAVPRLNIKKNRWKISMDIFYCLTSATNGISCWFACSAADHCTDQCQQHQSNRCTCSTHGGHGGRGGWGKGGGAQKAIRTGSLSWKVKPELIGLVHFPLMWTAPVGDWGAGSRGSSWVSSSSRITLRLALPSHCVCGGKPDCISEKKKDFRDPF